MVARLVRLRLTLLASVFRGGSRAFFRSALIGISGGAIATAAALAPQFFARTDAGRASIDVLFIATLLVLAAIVPFFAAPRLLEPRQFASLPAKPATLATAILVTTPLSWSGLWLLLWLFALIALRPGLREVPWAAVLAVLTTLLLAIALVRVSSALLRLAVPRRGVPVVRWAGLLLLLAALPVGVFVVAEALQRPLGELTLETVRVLGWTPFGAPAAALQLALQGETSGALARFGIAAGALLVLLAAWYLLVARSVTSVERPLPSTARDGLDAFERFPASPRAVISARVLTYWRRDPRYRVALFAIPIAPLVMFFAFWVVGAPPGLLALLPLPVILLLLGWTVHNDVAFDSTAIWMHVASGTRGRDDRVGRLAPVMIIGLPLVVLGSSLSVTFVGDWRVLPAVIGMNLAVLLVSSAVSSVFSVLMPYPTTRPGDSPFVHPSLQGSGAGFAQTLSVLASLVLVIAPIWVAVPAIMTPTLTGNIAALIFGALWGVAVLVFGVLFGGRLFERRGPELVALTQTFD